MKNDTFAKRLKKAMNKRKISQSELSRLTGISKSAISQYLSGKSSPKSKYIEDIANALEITSLWLYGENAPMELEDYYKMQEDLAYSLENRKNLIIDIYEKSCKMNEDGLNILKEFTDFLYNNKKYGSPNNVFSPFDFDDLKYLKTHTIFDEEISSD
jgi:transcriptional regulator with XRE-family HTH domain